MSAANSGHMAFTTPTAEGEGDDISGIDALGCAASSPCVDCFGLGLGGFGGGGS